MPLKPLVSIVVFCLLSIASLEQEKPYIINQNTDWSILNNMDTIHTLELDTLKVSLISTDVRESILNFSDEHLAFMTITEIDSVKIDGKSSKMAMPKFSKSFIVGDYTYDAITCILTLRTQDKRTLVYQIKDGTPRGFLMIKKKPTTK